MFGKELMLIAILCFQLRICSSKLYYAVKCNTYKFADYKEQVTELLIKVCMVSVKMMRGVGEVAGV
jgi:hypothetical protein